MRTLGFIFSISLLMAAVTPAAAQSVIERLVSPGALTAKHAKYEARCDACHSKFNKAAQTGLCRDCHKKVSADLTGHRGFHGKFAPASAACSKCHTEHKGRRADIVHLNKAKFDHRFTNYPLVGKHIGLKCAQCHKPSRKFRDAPLACSACHAAKDPHKGRLGKNCASCHSERGWRPAKFDHSKMRFSLEGAHVRAKCTACHANKTFADAPRDCFSCHRKNDKHHGTLGPNCGSCHSAKDWKTTHFNHDTTKFPLLGKHRSTACNACHKVPAARVKLPTDCNACHKKDDKHKGRYGPNCGSCHTAGGWKRSTFDHDHTSFPLLGKHNTIACTKCHLEPPRQKKLQTDCLSCHRKDDRHDGQLGKRCNQCHGEKDWKKEIRFDHDLAVFPLLGKHAKTACKDCHTSPRFKDAAVACIGCHKKDDRHGGALGPKCESCHNPSDWRSWTFDHDKQTHFALTGAHKTIACRACHSGAKKTLSTLCAACHRGDDIHQGGFGSACGRCHSTDSFRSLRGRMR